MNARDSHPAPVPPDPELGRISRSGIAVSISVDSGAVDPRRVGRPGAYPFTRGIFADG
ncbi:MAG TPA: hypothetical protein PKA20_16800, partial [Burkholderiaceae bacterium]|nr:hypothetical protein [Burkholderiaceae bacterium]